MSLTHIYQKSQKMMYFEVINGIWWCYQSQFRRCLLVGFQKLQNWLRREANTVERTARMFEEGTHHIEKNAVPRQTNKKNIFLNSFITYTHIHKLYLIIEWFSFVFRFHDFYLSVCFLLRSGIQTKNQTTTYILYT